MGDGGGRLATPVQAAQGGALPATGHDDDVLAQLVRLGAARGRAERLGARHTAVFTDRGPILLVTFETLTDIRARDPDGLPEGFALADAHGWSQLAIVAHGDTWFRDPAVYAHFDHLVEVGVFEDFDRVIFLGTGMGAQAACAFSVAAPGSVVVAVAPVATLDRQRVEWDDRYPCTRRMSFSDRYADAPLMVEAADEVYLFYDPAERLDAMHASLFTAPHVVKIRCRGFGASLAEDLRAMGVIAQVLALAGRGRLTAQAIHRLMRVRHRYVPWLRGVLQRLVAARRPLLAAMVCRAAVARGGGRLFRVHLDHATAQLAEQGRRLPPARPARQRPPTRPRR